MPCTTQITAVQSVLNLWWSLHAELSGYVIAEYSFTLSTVSADRLKRRFGTSSQAQRLLTDVVQRHKQKHNPNHEQMYWCVKLLPLQRCFTITVHVGRTCPRDLGTST